MIEDKICCDDVTAGVSSGIENFQEICVASKRNDTSFRRNYITCC